jgi:hypothetical protein
VSAGFRILQPKCATCPPLRKLDDFARWCLPSYNTAQQHYLAAGVCFGIFVVAVIVALTILPNAESSAQQPTQSPRPGAPSNQP